MKFSTLQTSVLYQPTEHAQAQRKKLKRYGKETDSCEEQLPIFLYMSMINVNYIFQVVRLIRRYSIIPKIAKSSRIKSFV